MKHYKYGGSTADRTVGCPAWVEQSKDIPRAISSSYADIGTMLHNCMELLLLDEAYETPQDCLGIVHKDYEVTQDLVDEKLTPAWEAFQELCKRYDIVEYEAETTMQSSDLVGGTSDLIACGPKVVVVGDWKFGDGIAVDPEDNKQGLFYTAHARNHIPDMFEGATKVVIAIIQPSNRGEETLKVWETDMREVTKFSTAFDRAVRTAEKGGTAPKAGAWCKFCPAQPTCPEKTGLAASMKRIRPDSLAHHEVSKALDLAGEIEAWIKAVKQFAHEQAEQGVKFEGWKLVEKRPTRKWMDEDAVHDKIKKAKKLKLDECGVFKMSSPAQLEKICKKKGVDFTQYAKYSHKTSSGNTLAKTSDKRPEIVASGALRELRNRLT